MIPVRVELGPASRWARSTPTAVVVGGLPLLVSGRLAELAPFEATRPVAEPVVRPLLRTPGSVEVDGELGGVPCRLLCAFDGAHWRLEVAGVASMVIAPRGSQLVVREERSAADALLLQAILGPALSLLLAAHGVLCLHASAVERDGRVALFVGESGAGKSTLARELAAIGWRRVCDDILPVALTRGGPVARPWFPQLRLDASDQYRGAGELSVARVFELACGEEVAHEQQTPRHGALTLVRHTVASRLFVPDLLSWQLGWAARFAQSAPSSTLRYPRRLDVVPTIGRLLDDVLS